MLCTRRMFFLIKVFVSYQFEFQIGKSCMLTFRNTHTDTDLYICSFDVHVRSFDPDLIAVDVI